MAADLSVFLDKDVGYNIKKHFSKPFHDEWIDNGEYFTLENL